MDSPADIPAELLDDEAVRFIAGRHNLPVREMLASFMRHEEAEERQLHLEENEKEILRGLAGRCHGSTQKHHNS